MAADNLSVVKKILDDENHLVERADQKSISMLSITGVFMVFFVVYYRIIPINPFTATMIILYFLCALSAIMTLIVAIRPRIRKEPDELKGKVKPPTVDPTFFSDICKFPNAAAYKETLETIIKDEASLTDVYIRQIYSVARINSVKYRHVQRGVLLVIMTLTIELILIAYLFVYHLGPGKMPPIN